MFFNNLKTNLDLAKLAEYSLVLGYFISLFSTTCFFFDTHQVSLLGHIIQLPIALIFFPITFALSNVIQDKFGPATSNSLILTSFVFDTLLVFAGTFIAFIGDRSDYWSVFRDMPSIMISTWFFLGISSVFNVKLYTYLNSLPNRFIFGPTLKFFITITATETLISFMSMPLLFYKHGLQGDFLLTTLLAILYKVCANLLLTFLYYFSGNR